MRGTLESTLPWWVAGPIVGLVIVSLLGLANKRFGVLGGVTDLVQGSSEGRGLRSWRVMLLLGIVGERTNEVPTPAVQGAEVL